MIEISNKPTETFPWKFPLRKHCDRRGNFVKIYDDANLPWRFDRREAFTTTSRINTFRGLHFQVPPYCHRKIVTCLYGQCDDFVVDLRIGASFGEVHHTILSGDSPESIYIPIGFAHGFIARVEGTQLYYETDVGHSPKHDKGVHWRGLLPLDGTVDMIISERDSNFPTLDEFVSPF